MTNRGETGRQRQPARSGSSALCLVLQRSALSPQSGPSLDITGLLVIFATSHFFLETAPHDQFAKASNRFLNGLAITNDNFYHGFSCN